jgi:peroxiredoxin
MAAPVLFLCLTGALAHGAGRAGEQAPDFPPGEFTDGGRYSLEDLKGKAVVLYLYEKG